MESYDWNGKAIIPFNTHEGSGGAETVKSIKSVCAAADFLDGLTMSIKIRQLKNPAYPRKTRQIVA